MLQSKNRRVKKKRLNLSPGLQKGKEILIIRNKPYKVMIKETTKQEKNKNAKPLEHIEIKY